ncbi:hypothetical protein STSP2_01392 [Anaerohalosphaera lusitana]|uniref:Uncharacterized protein n=1 Tax=Anaerohalosphaera lusitana TaxID=1936003 RepID=A0A1U9NL50_9BACT|nr:hypothetical protein [Anaerohalosphaera lusitana]AQT68236.1 hypothetical protein STSP2_01392 [Anaerohalosphaera lusitana]
MRKYNPYRNIFYYYRGPSFRKKDGQWDKQLEDNITKALVNTLENSDRGLLKRLMKRLGIKPKSYDPVLYDLQITEENSRPDALIKVGSTKIYIESKVDCPLEDEQILNHLQADPDSYLVCITPRNRDAAILDRLKDKRFHFITWKEVYLLFRPFADKDNDARTAFILQEFLDFLEATNMAPFSGWKKSHFEAFLNIEDDPKRELRLKVKDNMQSYLEELKQRLGTSGMYGELDVNVGNIRQDSVHCWGILCPPPLSRKIDVSHFRFAIDADAFSVGVLIGGKKPVDRFKQHTELSSDELQSILGKMDGFHLTLLERVQIRPRRFKGKEVAHILLGENICKYDIDYLNNKFSQYNLLEIRCQKLFKRDDAALGSDHFLDDSIELMKKLEPYYRFAWGE